MSSSMHFLANYLLNALWQSILLCAVAWLAARLLRPLGPVAEHRVWVTALCAQCLVPALAAPWVLESLRRWIVAGHSHGGTVTVTLSAAQPVTAGGTLAALVPFALAAWALVTAVVAIRFALQVRQLGRLERESSPLTLCLSAANWLRECCATLRIAQVTLLSTTDVETPVTFGLRKPVLVLPRDFAERVSSEELHAALAHELAHVARRDAAKQMLYRLMTLPLAWHPAVHLVLAQIAETRELVCDRTAAHMTGDARQYAISLLELASLLTARRPAHAHAIGLFDANQLERRVLMLNRRVFPVARSLRVGLIAASGVLAIGACTSAVALHLNAPSQPEAATSEQASPNGPVHISSNVAAGQVISRATPKYPAEAKKAHISGAVVLKAIIGKDGSVQNLQVLSGPEVLQASALDAVRQWVYKPYLLNGEPTEVETTITVTYSFDEKPKSAPAPGTPTASVPTASPQLVSQVDPVYPEAARKQKLSGEVLVSMRVDTNGGVSEVAALSGPEIFRQSAVDAVRQYRFSPAMRNGEPVPVDMRVEVKFQSF